MWLLLSLVGFLGFIVYIGALLWSVIKKNKDLRKKSLIGGLLAMIMFFIGVLISPTDKSESSVETAKTEQTSSSKKTSSSSKKEASSSSKTVSSTETSSTSKTYDDAANTAFASELNTKINDVLKQSGITDSFAVKQFSFNRCGCPTKLQILTESTNSTISRYTSFC